MCGRTACYLDPACIKKYLESLNNNFQVQLQGSSTNDDFKPGYNIPPGSYLPIIFKDSSKSTNILQPMLWGLVPSWYNDNPKSFDLKTSNARIEGLLEKPTFKNALMQGNRCVLVAEGFFEWKTINHKKQPHFITSDKKKTPLIFMAGIFDINEFSKTPLFSFTVITVPSSEKMSYLHHRMPALLSFEEAELWIDSEKICTRNAIKELLHSVNDVTYFPVTPSMNSTHFQGESCIKPMKPLQCGSSALMQNWLKRKSESKEEQEVKPKVKRESSSSTFISNWLKQESFEKKK